MVEIVRENDSPETLKRKAINREFHKKGVKKGGKVRNKAIKGKKK